MLHNHLWLLGLIFAAAVSAHSAVTCSAVPAVTVTVTAGIVTITATESQSTSKNAPGTASHSPFQMKSYSVHYFNATGSAATTLQSPTASSPYSTGTSSPLGAGDAHGNNGWSLVPESGSDQSAGVESGSGLGSTHSSSGSGSTSGSGLGKAGSGTSSSGAGGLASGSGSSSSGLGSSGNGGSKSPSHASSGHDTSGSGLSGYIPSGQGGSVQGGTSVNGTLYHSVYSSKHISPSKGTEFASGHSYHNSVSGTGNSHSGLPSATRLHPSYPFSTGGSYPILSSGIASDRPRVSPVGGFPTSVTKTRGVFSTGVPDPSGVFPSGSGKPSGVFPSGSGKPSGVFPSGSGKPSGVFPSGSGKPSGVFPSGSGKPSGVFPSGSSMPSGVFPTGNVPSGGVFSTNIVISSGVPLTGYSSTRTEAPVPTTSAVSSCLPVRPGFILGVTGGTPYDGRFLRLLRTEDDAGPEDIAVPFQNVAQAQVFSIDNEGQLATQPSGSESEVANIDGFSQNTLLFAVPDAFTLFSTYAWPFRKSSSDILIMNQQRDATSRILWLWAPMAVSCSHQGEQRTAWNSGWCMQSNPLSDYDHMPSDILAIYPSSVGNDHKDNLGTVKTGATSVTSAPILLAIGSVLIGFSSDRF